MRRAAICLAILSVASTVSVAVQGAKTQGKNVVAADRAGVATPEAKSGISAAVLAQDPSQYVGETVCLTCHETQKYDGTAHAGTDYQATSGTVTIQTRLSSSACLISGFRPTTSASSSRLIPSACSALVMEPERG